MGKHTKNHTRKRDTKNSWKKIKEKKSFTYINKKSFSFMCLMKKKKLTASHPLPFLTIIR
jgi:hypothetical protein